MLLYSELCGVYLYQLKKTLITFFFFIGGVKSVFSELHMFSGKINKLNDFHQKRFFFHF